MSANATAQGRTDYQFSNWSGSYTCQPELYFEPETTEEIKQILEVAREKGKTVRVVGKGHSFSDLVCTTDFLVSLCRYNKVLEVNKDVHQITVQGGCVVSELNNTILPSHGLALNVLGVIADVTVAGLISTGTHGTGANYGTTSSIVASLDLMTASGEIMHISKEENSELMPAAVLSLGALGVILNVTLQCEPAFNLRLNRYPAKMQDVLDNVDERLMSSDRFHVEVFPYIDGVVCHHAYRTTEEPKFQMPGKCGVFWATLIGVHALRFMLWLSSFLPMLMPLISRFFYRFVYGQKREGVLPSYRLLCLPGLPKHYAMEWALPREKLGAVLKELQSWFTKTGFPAHFPIFCSFAKREEDIYLSTAYGRDTCYINLLIMRPYDKEMKYREYWEAVERIVSPYGGRPHWGKDHSYGVKDFERLYPKWEEFCRLRRQLDPNGMFLNSHLERVFGTHSGTTETTL